MDAFKKAESNHTTEIVIKNCVECGDKIEIAAEYSDTWDANADACKTCSHCDKENKYMWECDE